MGKPGRDRASSPVNPGESATGQEVCHEGPSTRSWWGGYHPARPGGPPGAEGRLVPETSNLKHQTSEFTPPSEVIGLGLLPITRTACHNE